MAFFVWIAQGADRAHEASVQEHGIEIYLLDSNGNFNLSIYFILYIFCPERNNPSGHCG